MFISNLFFSIWCIMNTDKWLINGALEPLLKKSIFLTNSEEKFARYATNKKCYVSP